MQKKLFHNCCPLQLPMLCVTLHKTCLMEPYRYVLRKKEKGIMHLGKHIIWEKLRPESCDQSGASLICPTPRTCWKHMGELPLYRMKVALPEDSFWPPSHNMQMLDRQHCFGRSATKPQHYGITICGKKRTQ